MESPLVMFAVHWDHETRQLVGRGVLTAPRLGGLGTARPTYGSWRVSYRFLAFIGTVNRGPSRARRKAPINRTHSKRFARFGDARQSRSVWSACVFSAAFQSQATIR